jgi:hypothetical protein
MDRRVKILPILAFVASFCLMPNFVTAAMAQTSTSYSASNMWGTQPSGVSVPGALDSAIMHNQNGAAAGEVNAAQNGFLINGGGSNTINAIGSESIISDTINGNGSSIAVSASQSASNSGSVRNGGQIGQSVIGNTN